MAKRFGRNQKRKLKAKIEHLERQNSSLQTENKRIKELYKILVSSIERICPNSVCLPAKQIKSNINDDVFYIPVVDGDLFTKQKLYKITLMMETNKEFCKYVHLKIGNGKEFVYYLGKEYLTQFGIPRDILVELVVNAFKRLEKNEI